MEICIGRWWQRDGSLKPSLPFSEVATAPVCSRYHQQPHGATFVTDTTTIPALALGLAYGSGAQQFHGPGPRYAHRHTWHKLLELHRPHGHDAA